MDLRAFRALRDAGATWAEIARETGHDWRTVKKYLAPDAPDCPPAACARRPVRKKLIDDYAPAALRSIARRAQALRSEIRELDIQIRALLAATAPATLGLFAMGPDTTADLLVAIGDNPDRLRSEAAFARLCGVAPIPASSGKVVRHRLHRGGDRSANRALHIAVVVRMRYCPRTQAYVARRVAQGRSKQEVIRCLKRYLAREIFRCLRADYAALSAPT